MTILTEVEQNCLPVLPVLASSAVTRTINQFIPNLSVKNKWINDVFIHGKKAAGLLTKCSFIGQNIMAIIGIGVNIA
jgi:biotin-(acetyl-CoA carboxylase) ligase